MESVKNDEGRKFETSPDLSPKDRSFAKRLHGLIGQTVYVWTKDRALPKPVLVLSVDEDGLYAFFDRETDKALKVSLMCEGHVSDIRKIAVMAASKK
ncbi:hypothetical protein JW899_02680 [Candidatus Uhrbacteria bacterium]|nr:hypothetical protein [Candidatus Uhrbacteria bacterium]